MSVWRWAAAALRLAQCPPPGLRVASDVGGTFTDSLAYDERAERVTVAKLPTTPGNRALGTVQRLRSILAISPGRYDRQQSSSLADERARP